MRILLIGASGQLGTALRATFSGEDLVAASNRNAQPRDLRLDLADAAATASLLCHVQPELILLAGAMCNVDQCELQPETCERINMRGPSEVAAYARDHGARVVFFGTDHVFDGARSSYAEDDTVNPLNAYSTSKAGAENALRALLPDRHLIIRTGWVYGPDVARRNFVLRLVDRIDAGETVLVPSDQWGSPTYTGDLAATTRFLVERGATGTFHATGPELIDRVSLALKVCAQFGVDSRCVLPRATRDLGQAARRPFRVLLDCGKLWAAGAPPFRDIASGLVSLAAACEVRRVHTT